MKKRTLLYAAVLLIAIPCLAGEDAKEFISMVAGAKFILIPAGSFMMGSPNDEPNRESDETQHHVIISKSFYMQTTAVTQGQWKKVMGNNPAYFKAGGDDCPVENISWNDTQEFIRKLNREETTDKYRLPTEAEWEYAARAGTTTPFNTGNCLSSVQANYNGNNPYPGCPKGQFRKKTVPVACFAPNAWGLYDMHGNVWQWVEDWYGAYPTGNVTDPTGPSSGSSRIMRGGGWRYYANHCRSAHRIDDVPENGDYGTGFRLARTR